MTYFRTFLPLLTVTTLGLAFGGCAKEYDARDVDPSSEQGIKTVGGVDMRDYLRAADELTSSMLARGIFDPNKDEVILRLSRVRDDSSALNVDTELVTNQIRTILNASNHPRVLTITPGYEDPASADDRAMGEMAGQPRIEPQYTLSGRISNVNSVAGDARQTTFIFKMTLTDNRGLALWEDQRFISKAGTRDTATF